VNPITENSPSDVMVRARPRTSAISGTENAAFSTPLPGALCWM